MSQALKIYFTVLPFIVLYFIDVHWISKMNILYHSMLTIPNYCPSQIEITSLIIFLKCACCATANLTDISKG